jgi:hypothetical protein
MEMNIVDEIYNVLFTTTYIVEPSQGKDSTNIRINDNPILLENIENSQSQFSITKTDFTILSAIVLAVFGFLYMYISSMGMLIIHTFRFWIITIFITKTDNRYSAFQLYKKLATVRARVSYLDRDNITIEREEIKKDLHIRELVETYRHLREHGNAFGIIVLEVLFALVIIHCKLFGIIIWILTGVLAWIIGTYLEDKLTVGEQSSKSVLSIVLNKFLIFLKKLKQINISNSKKENR